MRFPGTSSAHNGLYVFFVPLMLSACARPAPAPAPRDVPALSAMIPWPAKLDRREGRFDGGAHVTVVATSDTLAPLARALTDELIAAAGATVTTVPHPPPDLITLALDESILDEEGYRLEVAPRGIRITARTSSGVFYGTRTLLQLVPPGQLRWSVPALHISDAPRFGWRGMLLDVSRHFFTPAEIERYLDLLAAYKLNRFHWHLSDDQGWRLPVPKRPRLTTASAFREDRRHEAFGLPPVFRKPLPPGKAPYGGAYTEEEIRRIVAYAAARGITVVPEIDLPGHAQAALAAYPELSCKAGARYDVAPGTMWPFSDPLCPCKPESLLFVADVLDAVVALFPGPWIHIGGDEVNTSSWTPACEAMRQRENLPDAGRSLEAWFMAQAASLVRARGRTAIVWEEAAEGPSGAPEQAIVMAWKSAAPVVAAARGGHQAINADSNTLYFDDAFYFDEAKKSSRIGWGAVEQVYRYDPVPQHVPADLVKFIAGVQGALWTEQVQTFAVVERALLPRLLALAETAWTPSPRKDLASFHARMSQHLPALAAKGHAVYVPSPIVEPTRAVFLDETRVAIRVPAAGLIARYTTDGSTPTGSSPIAPPTLIVRDTTSLEVRAFSPGAIASASVHAGFERSAPAAAGPSGGRLGLHLTVHEGRAGEVARVKALPTSGRGIADQLRLPGNLRGRDAFGLVFSGKVRVEETGIHVFCVTSNDGARLWIGGRTVVDNDGLHSLHQVCGQVALASGAHPIELIYFDDQGSEDLTVTHQFGRSAPVEVAASALSHD